MGKRRHKTNITAERLRMRSCVLPGLVFPFFRSLSENTLPAVVNACVQGKPQTQVAARGHLKPASRQRPQIAGVKSRRASGGPALPGGGLQKIAMSKSKTPETLSEKVCWNGRFTCEAAM